MSCLLVLSLMSKKNLRVDSHRIIREIVLEFKRKICRAVRLVISADVWRRVEDNGESHILQPQGRQADTQKGGEPHVHSVSIAPRVIHLAKGPHRK